MARGDVISDWSLNVGATTTVSVQPSSGVEWLITELSYSETADTDIALQEGGSQDIFIGYDTEAVAETDRISYSGTRRKFFATNSEYFKIRNASGAGNNTFYSGIQTK